MDERTKYTSKFIKMPESSTALLTEYSESSQTLLTLGDHMDTAAHDLHSFHSRASTITDTVLGRSITEFNHIRTLPIVSLLFKKGLYVFPSEESLLHYKSDKQDMASAYTLSTPLLKAVPSFNLGFKNTGHIMTFYKYITPRQKHTYCRVFTKIMKDDYGVIRYIFKFTPNGNLDETYSTSNGNFQVVMFSCTNSPINDCLYQNTKLRWIGSTLYEPVKSFKLLVLNSDVASLCDGNIMDDSNPVPNREANLEYGIHMNTETVLPPLARFVEHRSPSKRGVTQTGDMKAIEVFTGVSKNSVNDVPESTLVVCCMSMLLEEQRKNMGISYRSYDATMF